MILLFSFEAAYLEYTQRSICVGFSMLEVDMKLPLES